MSHVQRRVLLSENDLRPINGIGNTVSHDFLVFCSAKRY